MAKEKLMQSANFKRDYVTALAIGLFLLMIISEICVAVSIPLAVNYTSIYADHGTRQRMVTTFDTLRMLCIMPGAVNSPQINTEKAFIRADLDMLSGHLREYNRTMPMSDVEEVINNLGIYSSIIGKLNSPKARPFCKAETLKLDKITARIEKRLDSFNVSAK
ncbi:MAG: hypothetical protein IKB77_01740 [Lentisphaeria bacterium]|nr:hypothetical protein [Lentisphaeria bacterium]